MLLPVRRDPASCFSHWRIPEQFVKLPPPLRIDDIDALDCVALAQLAFFFCMKNRLIIDIANLWVYVWYARVVLRHILTCHEIPNPAYPKTVNDKFLWRKVFDHNPAFIGLSDKLMCKQICLFRRLDISGRFARWWTRVRLVNVFTR